jgi:hypothetical protein
MLLSATVAGASAVSQVAYGSLTGSQLVTFEDLPQISAPGTNYDGLMVSGGVAFGERFAGQTLTKVGAFDRLSGSPSGTLALQTGTPGENLNIFAGSYAGKYGNVLTGLGDYGFPSYDAIGEGSFALLFSSDQSEFGFSLIGGNGGTAHLDFFARNGSLLDSILLSGLSDQYYGFSRAGGLKDIAGISIWNDDAAGIAIDDIKHDVKSDVNPVPEPGTMMLLGSGLLGIACIRKRRI